MKTERRPQSTQCKVSIKSLIELHRLAEQIWEMYEDELRDIGIFRASTRVAIDYLLAVAPKTGYIKPGELNERNQHIR